MKPNPLQAWHDALTQRDPRGLADLIADDAVFHSPVVHRPQVGKALVHGYLSAAMSVLGNASFRYVRELADNGQACLEFEVEIDGVHVNGVDLIRWDASGRISDFKVMLRPLKAVQLIHEKMAAMLRSQ